MEVSKYFMEKLKDPKFRRIYERELDRYKVAEVIVKYRIENNLTQRQLGEKLGISQQYIAKLEEGNFRDFEKVKPFLKKMGYTIEIKVVPIKRED